ncbi:MAG: hypothetical protein HY720_02300 [Planctomycetes bacterium]|nr:hypothetical protein [Planctomycetota bacterium]
MQDTREETRRAIEAKLDALARNTRRLVHLALNRWGGPGNTPTLGRAVEIALAEPTEEVLDAMGRIPHDGEEARRYLLGWFGQILQDEGPESSRNAAGVAVAILAPGYEVPQDDGGYCARGNDALRAAFEYARERKAPDSLLGDPLPCRALIEDALDGREVGEGAALRALEAGEAVEAVEVVRLHVFRGGIELDGDRIALSAGWVDLFRELAIAWDLGEEIPTGRANGERRELSNAQRSLLSRLRLRQPKQVNTKLLAALDRLPGDLLAPGRPALNPAIRWAVEIR